MKTKAFTYLFLPIAFFGLLLFTVPAFSGDLEPTAAPEPTMHTLDEIYNSVGGGVTEINQTRALEGGVTPGDTPGFPVTISVSGSYQLTSNLEVADTATGAIDVVTDVQEVHPVEIDMNGFSVLGPGVCSATYSNNLLTAVACNPAPAGGFGIRASSRKAVNVHDGTVRGVGGHGVDVGEGLVYNIIAMHNGGTGVRTSDNSLVRNIRADLNDGAGISISDGMLESAVVTRSDSSGVHAGGAVVRRVHVQWSKANGIQTGFGAQVYNCVSVQNGWSGVTTAGQSLIVNNNIRHNGQWGIVGDNSQTTGYGGNFIWDNDSGSVTGTAMITIDTNVCGNDTNCAND
jgi:hypothetical protein